MAYVVVRSEEQVDEVVAAITEAHGFQPTVFRDGKVYRVQHNDIGSDALHKILADAGIKIEAGG